MGYRKGRFSFEEKNYALNFHCAKNGIFCWGFLQQMWANPQFLVDLVTFTEEILNGKLYFSSSVCFERFCGCPETDSAIPM